MILGGWPCGVLGIDGGREKEDVGGMVSLGEDGDVGNQKSGRRGVSKNIVHMRKKT
jgi:hypothetical protein